MERTISMSENNGYDVIVAGGGPAGCAAAAAAAKNGAKTLLIERAGFLGGMSSGGMVPEFCPYTDGEKIIHNGIAKDVLFKMKQVTPDSADKLDYCAINAEQMKLILDGLVTDAGADILFYSAVCGAETDNGRVKALYVSGKSGIRRFGAEAFVDCTGDADAAAFAGCEYEIGAENGKTQMPTLCFDMCGIDDSGDKPIEGMVREILPEIIKDEEFPLIDNNFFCAMKIGEGLYGVNAGHIYGTDCLNAQSISAAMISGRKKAFQYLGALKKYMPEEFANAQITQTAPMLGVRETRRIKGCYTLTARDYCERRSFFDDIGRNSYSIDLHDAEWFYQNVDLNAQYAKYKAGESHGIPYRCLVPRKLENMLVAGRSISCERAVQSSIRIIPVCFVTGEAAGTAASIMVRDKCSARDVNIEELLGILKSNE